MRIDCNVTKADVFLPLHFGFENNINKKYTWGDLLGKGGFGTVKTVQKVDTKQEFACKIVSKNLVSDSNKLSKERIDKHIYTIKREIEVLRALKGSINIVGLEEVFEDNENVYIVMECCKGGELFHRIGLKNYNEKQIAKIMRAVLRTLVRCHANGILHRDIKPGNFMFLKKDNESAIKAVDFGLAVFFDNNELPRRDLGFDGTAWFMAPEVLSSEVVPASDIWSAGVMAYQLLSGYLPFDDHKNKKSPSLSLIWRSILTEEPNFSKSAWKNVSQEAIDFVKTLLNKDPSKRPTAEEALKHSWVKKDGKNLDGKKLSTTIVQRIQRFGQSGIFKRTILEMIAKELLDKYLEKTKHKIRNERNYNIESDKKYNTFVNNRTWHGALNIINVKTIKPSEACHYDCQKNSQFEYYSQSDLDKFQSKSIHGWENLKKVCRLALDTSSHGSNNSHTQHRPYELSNLNSHSDSLNFNGDDANSKEKGIDDFQKNIIDLESDEIKKCQNQSCKIESAGRGQSYYKDFIESQGINLNIEEEEKEILKNESFPDNRDERLDRFIKNIFGVSDTSEVKKIFENLKISTTKNATEEELNMGLNQLGYTIGSNEIHSLVDNIAPGNKEVGFTQFIASQIDWKYLQNKHREEWLNSVKQAFKDLDMDEDGKLNALDIINTISSKIPNDSDINLALEQARIEACADELNLSFDKFVELVNVDSNDTLASLDLFDSRYEN